MYFINVEVSFICAGMWFTWCVTPYMLAVFYPNHSIHPLVGVKSTSTLKVSHVVHNLCSIELVPSAHTNVLTPPQSECYCHT